MHCIPRIHFDCNGCVGVTLHKPVLDLKTPLSVRGQLCYAHSPASAVVLTLLTQEYCLLKYKRPCTEPFYLKSYYYTRYSKHDYTRNVSVSSGAAGTASTCIRVSIVLQVATDEVGVEASLPTPSAFSHRQFLAIALMGSHQYVYYFWSLLPC